MWFIFSFSKKLLLRRTFVVCPFPWSYTRCWRGLFIWCLLRRMFSMLKFFHTIIMLLSFNGEKGYLYRCVNILFLICGILMIDVIHWILCLAWKYSNRSPVNVCYNKGHAVSQIIIPMATILQIRNTCFVIFSFFLFSSTVCKAKVIDIIVHCFARNGQQFCSAVNQRFPLRILLLSNNAKLN